eukprot:9445908-Alexandrium_andersonii.AAC.1
MLGLAAIDKHYGLCQITRQQHGPERELENTRKQAGRDVEHALKTVDMGHAGAVEGICGCGHARP